MLEEVEMTRSNFHVANFNAPTSSSLLLSVNLKIAFDYLNIISYIYIFATVFSTSQEAQSKCESLIRRGRF